MTDPAPGILPYQAIEALAGDGAIAADTPLAFDQLQPASLDLRLGGHAWRVRASFLPGPDDTVAERVDEVAMHRLDLTDGAVLERGCVYIAELQERLSAARPGSRRGPIPRAPPGGWTCSCACSPTAVRRLR